MKNLRLVDLSDNRLNFLSEYSFREDSLEVVWLAQNRFVRIPLKSFTPMVAASLRELDLSSNSIDSLYSVEFRSAAIFKVCEAVRLEGGLLERFWSQKRNTWSRIICNLSPLGCKENFRKFLRTLICSFMCRKYLLQISPPSTVRRPKVFAQSQINSILLVFARKLKK